MPTHGEATRYLVCYDIPDTPRRNRIAKCLDDFGGRVQYSVFEMVLDHRLFDKLIEELTAIVDPASDRVSVYPLCAACSRKSLLLGRRADEVRPGDEIVFIH
ncbi:CRISPR-associated endonuclease Cas2 [Tautonia marina]|uniref:CRISPR-associated endonuclease Cas2 n=1 Tax=Tautonia marina TaxID=2653855 RepID=UPI0012612BC6|nr:CRISPR-associated endonuclease Cas2 [Tautonia marina]